VNSRSARAGALASVALAALYSAVVWGASGSFAHLASQARRDWYFLVLIIAGFGTQVALLRELRRRHRLQQAAAVAGGASVGASTAGMVACCAHHLADFAPFLGATGAAAFLLDYRIPMMVAGIAINAIGVAFSFRRLRRTPTPLTSVRAGTWAHA